MPHPRLILRSMPGDPMPAGVLRAAADRAERIEEWQAFHDEPALAMADDAELRTADGAAHLVEGTARLFPGRGMPARPITPGQTLTD